MNNTVLDYQEAAKAMLSAASINLSAGYTIIEDFINYSGSLPLILIDIPGETTDWGYNVLSGSFTVMIVENYDQTLDPDYSTCKRLNKKAISVNTYNLINQLFLLKNTQVGFLIEPKFSFKGTDFGTTGPGELDTETPFRMGLFTISWGLTQG